MPVLALAPAIQDLLGVREAWAFPGTGVIQFVFASVIFFYGCWSTVIVAINAGFLRMPG